MHYNRDGIPAHCIVGVMQFTESELGGATRNFDINLKVGEGGFGTVYKGCLRGTCVAVKVLSEVCSTYYNLVV